MDPMAPERLWQDLRLDDHTVEMIRTPDA